MEENKKELADVAGCISDTLLRCGDLRAVVIIGITRDDDFYLASAATSPDEIAIAQFYKKKIDMELVDMIEDQECLNDDDGIEEGNKKS
jgi:hypothetical protein